MASTIVSVNSLNNIQMVNGTWARSLPVPSGWSKLRVGLLMHQTDLTTGPVSTPQLAVGLCHNTTNLMGMATTDHFAGVVTNAASWSYSSTDKVYFGISCLPITMVGTTQTNGSGNIATNAVISYISTVRNVWFIDITKGSPNYTFNLYNQIGISPIGDVSISTFLAGLVLSNPGISQCSFGTAQTVAVNEATNGTLNAVNVFWNRSDFYTQISAIGVALLA